MRATSSLNSSNTPHGQYLTNETLVQTGRQPSAGIETAGITKAAPAPGHRPETAQDQRAVQRIPETFDRCRFPAGPGLQTLDQQQNNNCPSNV